MTGGYVSVEQVGQAMDVLGEGQAAGASAAGSPYASVEAYDTAEAAGAFEAEGAAAAEGAVAAGEVALASTGVGLIVAAVLVAAMIVYSARANHAVKAATPQIAPTVAPCEAGTAREKEKEKSRKKKSWKPIFFITCGKPLPPVMVPPDVVAKQLGLKIKSDRYHERYYPLDFRLSKTARDLGVTETAQRGEVSVAARAAWDKYDHEVTRLTERLGYGRAWIDIGGGGQVAVLTDPDFAVICSDIDLLAVFDPEDDVSFAYDLVGSGVETTRQRALVTALKPFWVEHGIEAQNPDAPFPIRDGKAHCRGQPYDRLDKHGHPRRPCSAGLEVRGKWFLYRIDVEYTDDSLTGFVGPNPIETLESERDVVAVFNDKGINPRSVPPNPAWKWRTIAPGRWAPSAEHSILKPRGPAARHAGPASGTG